MIISVINQKGGTGKTTTVVNLGSALQKAGKSILLVDLDPQGNMGYSLGISDSTHTIAEVFTGEVSFPAILVKSEGLLIAPADQRLSDAELSIYQTGGREYLLREMLKTAPESDFILIDCPPSLSLLTVNALTTSDAVLIPMQMEVLSLQGLDLIIQTIQRVKAALNPALKVLGILPVMLDKRRKLSSEIMQHIRENYEVKIFEASIRTSVRVSEAPSFGKSVIDYDPECTSARDYVRFAEEFLTEVDR